MGLSKYKLGDLIQESLRKNDDLIFDVSFVRGISNNKQIVETKATVDDNVIRKFYIVNPGEFVYNPRTTRMGDKLGLAYNDTATPLLFSFNNIAFGIRASAKDTILPEYLYMFFNRTEFDRYAMAHGWGSATELFSFDEMCNVKIQLPDISVQRKYVAVYNAMLANQQSYERGLEDLKLTIDATVEKYKRKLTEKISLERLITECDLRNSDNKFHIVYGVNKDKQFMPTVTSGEDLSKYKVVQNQQFACNLMHVGRDGAIPVALNNMAEAFIISPAYLVFEINTEKIIPEFFMIWFSREETDRMAWFMCDSNIRGGMDKRRFYDMTIPVPPKEEQLVLVEMYEALRIRKEINEKLKTQIKDLCPILIKGSIEEAQD